MRPPGNRQAPLGLGLGGAKGSEGPGDSGRWRGLGGRGVEAFGFWRGGISGWEAGAGTPWCLSFPDGRPGWFWGGGRAGRTQGYGPAKRHPPSGGLLVFSCFLIRFGWFGAGSVG